MMRVVAALLLSLAVAAPARGEKSEAERFFRAGARAYESGQYEVACRALEQAYELDPLPAIAFSLAQAYWLRYFADAKPEFLERAKVLYQRYVEETPKGGRRHDAVTALAEIEPLLARIDPSHATVEILKQPTQLLVTCEIESAHVSIDGGDPVPLPATVEVAAGPHRLLTSADGYFDQSKNAIAVDGRLIVEEIALVPRPATIALSGDPGRILVDGRPAGDLPTPIEVAAGPHTLTVLANGRRRWDRSIEVTRGQALDLGVELRATPQRYLAWTALGGAALAAAGGALATFGAARANHLARGIEDRRLSAGITPHDLDAYHGHLEDRSAFRGAAIGLYTTAAALALTGTLLYLFDEP